MKIRTKSIIILLIMTLLPLAIIGVIAYKRGEEAIKKSLGSSFQQIAHQTVDKVDRNLYEVYHNLRTWAELDLMQEVITGDIDGKITSFLMRLSNEYGYFSDIDALNSEGKIVASSNPAMIGNDLSDDECYKDPMTGKSYIGDIHYDKMINKWVVTFSFSISAKFDENKIAGVLHAKWKADELYGLTQLKKIGRDEGFLGQIILIRNDGLIIAAPEERKDCIFQFNLIEAGAQSAFFVSQKKEGYMVETDEHNEKSLIAYDYSKGYRDFPGLGWAALVVKDADTAFTPIRQLKTTVMFIGVIVALIAVVISLIIARRMSNPILKISQVATRVTHGDLEGKVDYSSSDELGSLIKDFNRMIEELKKQREELEASEKNFRSIFQSVPEALLAVNDKLEILNSNKAYEELIHKYAHELDMSEDNLQDTLFTKLREYWDKTQRGTVKIGDNNRELVLEFDFAGKFITDEETIVLSLKDITERVRLTEEIILQKAYFQQLFENSPQGIAIVDNKDRIIDINKGFEILFQFSPDEIKGKYINDIIIPEDRLEEASNFSQTVLNGKILQTENIRKRKDGKPVNVSILGYPIEIDNKQIGVYGIYNDITERKLADKTLKKTMNELEHFNKLAVGRELQMIELKKEINKLLKANGKKEKYKIHSLETM